jgi:hypothetical protein
VSGLTLSELVQDKNEVNSQQLNQKPDESMDNKKEQENTQ